MPPSLNQLPVEVIQMIFGYLWAHEILVSFRRLSGYLDQILLHYPSYLINFQSIRKSHFDLVCRSIRPEQVLSLTLADKTDTPGQSRLFGSLFSIGQFTRLRALKCAELDDESQVFFSSLFKLPQLTSFEVEVKIDLAVIRSSSLLQRLVIRLPSGVHFDLQPFLTKIHWEQLRHLSLSPCPCAHLQKIFRQALRLTSLEVTLTLSSDEELNGLRKFDRTQSRFSALKSLSMTIEGVTQMFDRPALERFLGLMPDLRRLELVMVWGVTEDYLDAHRWESFLVQHLSRLMKFDFNFSSPHIDKQILNAYRSPFWLDRRWYVASDSNWSHLCTVPRFILTSRNHSSRSMSANCTTLPPAQHQLFYERVTELTLKSDRLFSTFPYHHLQQLCVECPLTRADRFDLSSVRSLRVNTSYWPFHEMLPFIQQAMPSLHSLSLNCSYADLWDGHLPKISLPQVRTLTLPQYGNFEGKDSFHWADRFPNVERLVVSIHSKRQLAALIEHFKKMVSAFFFLEPSYIAPKKHIQVTREWIQKHLSRSRERNANNFTYEMDNLYSFSLSLWIGEFQSDERGQWWRQCFPSSSSAED